MKTPLSDSQVALGTTFANADRIPLEPIPWMFIIPGFVIAGLAAATLKKEWRVPGTEDAPLVGGHVHRGEPATASWVTSRGR